MWIGNWPISTAYMHHTFACAQLCKHIKATSTVKLTTDGDTLDKVRIVHSFQRRFFDSYLDMTCAVEFCEVQSIVCFVRASPSLMSIDRPISSVAFAAVVLGDKQVAR